MKSGFLKSSTPAALSIVVIALALLVLASFGIRTIGSGGWWTHLATGRLMAEEGGVPQTDQFTFTNANEELIAPNWLYDKTVYSVWSAGGPAGVILLHVLAVLAAFAIMIPLVRRWSDFPAIALSLLLSAWLISFRFGLSASLMVLIFPAIFLSILYGNVRPVTLWTVIPLSQWLWTNMCGSFLLGPVLCLLMALQSLFPGDEKDRAMYAPKQYLGLGLLCFGVTFLNPYGPKLHSYILSQWNDPSLVHVNEWISPFASQFQNSLPSILLIATLVIGAAGLITYRRKLPLMLTIIVVFVAFLTVRSMRHIEIMVVLAFPFICLTMQASMSALGDFATGMLKTRRKGIEYIASAGAIVVAIFSLWSIYTNDYYSRTGSEVAFGLGVQETALPAAAAAIIENPDFPERALNLPLDGGYLAWRYPLRKIFVDMRSNLYSVDFYEQLNKALWGDDEAWNKVVNENDVEAIIIPCAATGSGDIGANVKGRENWNLAYFDGTTAVFLRNDRKCSSLLQNRDLRKKGLETLESAHREYIEQLRSGGRVANNARLIGAGNLFYSFNRLKRASHIFELITEGSPNMTGAWMTAGIARARMGEEWTEDAVYMLENALQHNPEMPLAWGWLSRCYETLGQRGKALEAYENGIEINENMARVFARPGHKE